VGIVVIAWNAVNIPPSLLFLKRGSSKEEGEKKKEADEEVECGWLRAE
jgi:hypothetical protein